MPLLFSYGTLQQDAVQLSTFGRLLQGHPDALVGFEQSLLKIEDPEFVATSGKAHHAIVTFNGRQDSRVPGTVFEVTDSELAKSDRYEPAGYTRISATLASGQQAWVYADARTLDRRAIALEFLRHARAGERAAAERLLAPGARHHNPYFAAGMPTLLDAIEAAGKANPDTQFDVKRVVAGDNVVVVHSHVRHRPGDLGISVVHIFRFDGDRIAELWDVGQLIPPESPNTDGMF